MITNDIIAMTTFLFHFFLYFLFTIIVIGAWKIPDSCVSNKTFHFIGNSISRSWAFNLHEILRETQTPMDRSMEKKICKSGKTASEGESCYISVKNTTIYFSWMWSIYSEALLLALEEPADYVLFNVGSHYVLDRSAQRLFRSDSEVVLLYDFLDQNPDIQKRLWYRTSTRLCALFCAECEPHELMNEKLKEQNDIIMNELDGLNIRFFDAWTTDSVCPQYDDNIHSKALAKTQLLTWLERDIC
jgi:hypothetical protein